MKHKAGFAFSPALAAALLISAQALGQDSSQALALDVYTTFHSAGIRLSITGDANRNARALLELRGPGGGFKPAHPLLRVSNGKFIGSALFLETGEKYDVRVTLVDPDNSGDAVLETSFTTRGDAVPIPGHPAKTIYVSPDGDDGAEGTASHPLASIQEAVSRSVPGTVIRVMPGTYRESVEVNVSGEPGNPIVIQAEPGAVLDGSDQDIQSGDAEWTRLDDDIWWLPFHGQCLYAAYGRTDLATRLYDYHSLADLRSKTAGMDGGFFVDESSGRIYLRLPDRSDPNNSTIHIARLPGAFLINGAHDIVIDGFEMRFYGSTRYSGFGVDLRGATRVWVRKSYIHNLNTGVRMRKGASECVVEHNHIEDTGVWTWPWSSVKRHTAEASGITVSGGRGNVVRFNTIKGTFNGIYIGEFSDSPDPEVATETDVYGNLLEQNGDDGLEPEGACTNVRLWSNTIIGVLNAVSLAPIQVGPTWVIRNLLLHYKAHALKLNNGSTGPILVYHNTALPMDDSESAQAWEPSLPFGPLWSKNNIWSAHRYVIEYGGDRLEGPVEMDYDGWWTDRDPPIVKWLGTRYDTLEDFSSATSMQKHGIFAEPIFQDPGSIDFRLAAGHPFLDAGTLIPGINDEPGQVPDGRPDMGAVERSKALDSDSEKENESDALDTSEYQGESADALAENNRDALDSRRPDTADMDQSLPADTEGDTPSEQIDAPRNIKGSCGCSSADSCGLTFIAAVLLVPALVRRKE